MFGKEGLFYTNDPSTVFDSQWLLDNQKIKDLTKHRLVILDLSSEHYGIDGIDHIYHAFDKNNVNFLLLTHDIHDHLRLPKLLFYSHWYYYSINQFNFPTKFPQQKNFIWSCLNCNPRPHRIYNFYIAKSKSYFDQSIFSMHDYELSAASRSDDPELPVQVLDFWANVNKTLPHKDTIEGLGLDLDIPAFTDCYIHLTSESTVLPRVFITEKSWKPIASQQLFLCMGNPGIIQALRMLGVDTYDDIIDHSYDNETDWQRRIDLIYQSLESLAGLDLEDVYRQTKIRRKKNFDLFITGSFGLQYKQDLLNAIDTHLK